MECHARVSRALARVHDKSGVWAGEFWGTVELLRVDGDQLRHVPNMFSIGLEWGYSQYVGQPKACFSSSSSGHFNYGCSS